MIKKAVFFSILLIGLISGTAMSQSLRFELNTKTQVEVGEQFQLDFVLNAEGSAFSGPDFKGFTVLNGPMMSTSSNINIINGRVDKSFNQTYTYIISAPKTGEYTIAPASVTVKGERVFSNKATIRVVQSSSSGNTAASGKSEAGNANDLFLKVIPDKRKVVLGEQLIVTYRLYTRIPVVNLNVVKVSSFPGFWMKNLLDTSRGLNSSKQIINGVEYAVADIRQVALFPQKTGTFSIDPMEVSCLAQMRVQTQRPRDPFESFFNDPFFNRNIQNVEKSLTSESLSIQVDPLPTTQRPSDFKGAVGQFGLQSSIDRTQVKTGDAINLSYTITGTGNLELIEFPSPAIPSDFEVYEPKITNDIKTESGKISGSRKIEYLIIPRLRGNYTIPALKFSYYDPNTSKYNTLNAQDYLIVVEKGEGIAVQEGMTASSQEKITYLGSDIRYINLKKSTLKKNTDFFFGSWGYILILLAGIALFSAALWYQQKLDRLRSNQSLRKLQQATKMARKKLANAKTHLQKKDENAFYLEMSQALWGYISDKFTIPRSELSIENVRTVLLEHNVPNELVEDFIATLNNFEYARFAPGDANHKMDEMYRKGIELIAKVEGAIR